MRRILIAQSILLDDFQVALKFFKTFLITNTSPLEFCCSIWLVDNTALIFHKYTCRDWDCFLSELMLQKSYFLIKNIANFSMIQKEVF